MPPSPSARQLLNQIYDMYAVIRLGCSDVCRECAALSFWKKSGVDARIGPVPIYHVGDNYAQTEKKIVFVGSVGYGWKNLIPQNEMCYGTLSLDDRKVIMDKMAEAQEYLYYHACTISIYRALKEISIRLYGNVNGFDNIAFLNLVHCNDGNTRNNLPIAIKHFCCGCQVGYYPFKRTLDILKPDIVVSMCNKKDEWILKQSCIAGGTCAIGPFAGHPSRKPVAQYAQTLLDFIHTH
jgi:hypothetical protein